MIENLKDLVNDEQMINENKAVELKMGKITISADVIEGNNLEKIFGDDEMIR